MPSHHAVRLATLVLLLSAAGGAPAAERPSPVRAVAAAPVVAPRARRAVTLPRAPAPTSPDPARTAAERAAALEARRKAFFAPRPDAPSPASPSSGAGGATLGGSDGLTPSFGLKF